MNALHQRMHDHGPAALNDAELLALITYRFPTNAQIDAIRQRLTGAGGVREYTADDVYAQAASEIARRELYTDLKRGPALTRPDDSGAFLRARLRHLPYEVFACLYLDNRHRVLAFEELFRGTIDGASVHPREVVRDSLKHNAAAVIFAHNHPSGVAEPSNADRAITHTLREALGLIGVRVLDHLVIGSGEPVSMAERGLI